MKADKDETALVEVPKVVAPVLDAMQIAGAVVAYKKMQSELDKAMPDQIIKIGDKNFRRKGYWRALRTAFNLKVECINESRTELDGDWGYEVTYRATAPNGATADGDGSCFASEKSRGRMAATVHNVRAHAHTRAFNRAVSNLVGFGEVSAEEVNNEDRKPNPQQKADAESKNPPPRNGREYNRAYTGKEGDPTVDIPAVFKTKPKSGKSIIYTIDGKDVVFPIGHVRSFFNGCVEVTGWIADKKIESGDLAPEMVRDERAPSDGDIPEDQIWNSAPYGDDDVTF